MFKGVFTPYLYVQNVRLIALQIHCVPSWWVNSSLNVTQQKLLSMESFVHTNGHSSQFKWKLIDRQQDILNIFVCMYVRVCARFRITIRIFTSSDQIFDRSSIGQRHNRQTDGRLQLACLLCSFNTLTLLLLFFFFFRGLFFFGTFHADCANAAFWSFFCDSSVLMNSTVEDAEFARLITIIRPFEKCCHIIYYIACGVCVFVSFDVEMCWLANVWRWAGRAGIGSSSSSLI